MIELKRTNSVDQDFIKLVQKLDLDLQKRDGEDHPFYAQFNKLDNIKYVVVAYYNGDPLGCGAIKEIESETMEVKRMFTETSGRGKGVATAILKELENWAAELGYRRCMLETGKKQQSAISLYKKNNYKLIPNYGQYKEIENSVCFEKIIIHE